MLPSLLQPSPESYEHTVVSKNGFETEPPLQLTVINRAEKIFSCSLALLRRVRKVSWEPFNEIGRDYCPSPFLGGHVELKTKHWFGSNGGRG